MAKFMKCSHCGNVVLMVEDKGVPVVCCGEPMQELKAGVEDAALEKHVPAVTVNGDTVDVVIGDVEHPMVDEHYIQFIYLETENGGQMKKLTPTDAPKASFKIGEQNPVAVYELCNLHGLWKKEL